MIKSLALFVNALYKSDQQFVALNDDLAQFTNSFTNTDQEVATALQDLNQLLTTTREFLDKNGKVLTTDVNNLADVDQRDPAARAAATVWRPACTCSRTSAPTSSTSRRRTPVASSVCRSIDNFANPMQFICSSIQAGSRLGYQESAELCAQYLAPILDAIKFNYPPFGLNQFNAAMTLPKQIAYSEPRLQPPPGYKDTTVPGIFSPRHVVLARQPRAGLDRRTGHAGRRRAAVHRRTC